MRDPVGSGILPKGARSKIKVAVLDDYQGVALSMADWSELEPSVDVVVHSDHVDDESELVVRLSDVDALVVMRERTPLTSNLFKRLPKLQLVITTGMVNAAIDMVAARNAGVVVSGTRSDPTAAVELTWALILGLQRRLCVESESVKNGGWQTTVGMGLAGNTIGVLGLGRIGTRVARIARAFDMTVLAWSAHLSATDARSKGVERVELRELLERADVVTVHLGLGERTRGLIGSEELGWMRRTSILVNTARGPIVETEALLAALEGGVIAGAAVDVFDTEPLPDMHPLRRAPNALITPHLGYVTDEVYRIYFGDVVEGLRAFLKGSPMRVLN